MKHIILLVLLSGLWSASSYGQTLSSKAEISLLTCSPGKELYSLFGHTAFRMNDPATQTDVVFNFGTFDFNTQGFYLKFARGTLLYQLSTTSWPNFLYNYQMENRTIYSQTLLLDSLEKQKLWDLLLENHLPENRSYLYNFLFDNCTTRSRDIIQKSLPENIEWHLPDTGKNFWNLLDEYLQISPWAQWGIHTILGQPGTREATTFEYMFLPDYLMYSLNTATLNNKRLVADTETLYQASDLEISPWYVNPLFVFAAGVLLLILLMQKYRSVKLLNTVSVLLFLFTGLLGALIIFLGFFTKHPITAPNWNILWANPLNLIAVFFIACKYPPKMVFTYLLLYMGILTIAIPVWGIAQPAVPLASISMIILMIYLCFRLRGKRFLDTK